MSWFSSPVTAAGPPPISTVFPVRPGGFSPLGLLDHFSTVDVMNREMLVKPKPNPGIQGGKSA